MSLIFPKKEILYAPMLGTLGGGSARGFGRGGGAAVGIEAATGAVTENTYDGITFYQSTTTAGTATGTSITLTTIPGNQFYIGMVGAGAGGHQYSNSRGGSGGVGIALVTVPEGVTTMTAYIGGCGDFENNGDRAYGGQYFGGNGGDPSGGYNASTSGGGLTALITGGTLATNTRSSTLICCVGSGGGGGDSMWGGHGGGFNRGGLDGHLTQYNYEHGGGATITSGGARSTDTSGHTNQDQTSGGIYQGGQGGSGQYDGGGGGGAGYYGGGGGKGGGGYSGGAAGGGSGYLKTSDASLIYTADGGPNNSNISMSQVLSKSGVLQTQIRASFASSYTAPTTTLGDGGGPQTRGNAGFVVMWNP